LNSSTIILSYKLDIKIIQLFDNFIIYRKAIFIISYHDEHCRVSLFIAIAATEERFDALAADAESRTAGTAAAAETQKDEEDPSYGQGD